VQKRHYEIVILSEAKDLNECIGWFSDQLRSFAHPRRMGLGWQRFCSARVKLVAAPMKHKRKPRQANPKRRSRPRMFPITPEMQHWSAMLESELKTWPGVVAKRLFSHRSFYRGKSIFAALPRVRSFHSPTSIIFKFDSMPPALLEEAQADSRLDTNTRLPGKGWFSFELRCDDDLRDALFWLNQSYECAH
jgi:hypothetical protein